MKQLISKIKSRYQISYNRNFTIDALRALAIILMTFVHTRMYTYTHTNSIWVIDKLSDFGGNIAYSLFLFCFGYGLYFSLLSKKNNSSHKKNWKRFWYLLSLYYLISFIGYFAMITSEIRIVGADFDKIVSHPNFWQWISEDLISILSGKRIVYLVDFLISFPLILLISLTLKRIIQLIVKSDWYIYFFSLTFLLIAYFVYKLTTASGFGSFFWGYGDMHYFPVLFYFIIFLLGARWALIDTHASTKYKSKWLLKNFFIFLILGLISNVFQDFERFTPSIPFLSYGISVILGTLLIINLCVITYKYMRENGMKTIRKHKIYKSINSIQSVLYYIGQNSLKVFIIHTVFIYIYIATTQPIYDVWYNSIIIWFLSLATALLI